MPMEYRGDNIELFQKVMGKGGVIGSGPRRERPATKPPTAPAATKGDQSRVDTEKGQ